MRYQRIILFSFLVTLLVGAGFALAAEPAGKMPITTSSEQAKSAFLEGRALAEKLKAQDSLQHFQKAIQADPNFALAYLNMALAAPTPQAFFENLKKAVSLAGKASETERLWILAVDAGANGKPIEQGGYFQQIVAALPNDERAHNLLGVYFFGLQQYDKCIEELQKAVTINPSFTPSYNMLGYAYRFQAQYDKSEQAFKKYIQLIPDDPNPYDSYAELLMRIGRYDESIQNYRKALALDSHFVNSYLGVATDLDFQGKHEDARKELQVLLNVARNDGERRLALQGMTISYVFEGNPQKALDAQQQMLALAQKTKDATAMTGDFNTMGQILLESGRAQEARAKFDLGLKATAEADVSADVKKIAGQNHLFLTGQAALSQKDLKTAHSLAADFQKQAEAGKNQFLIWLAHQLNGMIALDEKNYDAAIRELQQANQQDPYNQYRLALAYQGKGDKAKAAQLFKSAADFNGLNNLNYAFIRSKARKAAA